MHQAIEKLIERFGLRPDIFDRLDFFTYDDGIWVGTRSAIGFDGLPAQRRGIKLLRVFDHSAKPTTNGMQVFGRWCRRNRVELARTQAEAFVTGHDVRLDGAGLADGFVVAYFRRFPLGVGLYKSETGTLKSQVPRSRRLPSDT